MDSNMVMSDAEPPPPVTIAAAAVVQLRELVFSLEKATQMAKQLPATSDQTYLSQIYSTLHQAHHSLSSFLLATQSQIPLLPPLPQPFPLVATENSLSSSNGAANEGFGEPMQVGEENKAEAEENSKISIGKVEERMRKCFIINKRPKRRLSPSSAAVAEEKRISDGRFVRGVEGFGPKGEKLRALDLVYQFHC
ncbi:hypothetical protein V6N13_003128 [Hibiscus sabdariffa]|uniref:Uncharacterized protein n=1 Tax=Hibiscus sabdariffa TaxID=183260 RepID=A0ABR2NDV2_9ROSI